MTKSKSKRRKSQIKLPIEFTEEEKQITSIRVK